MTTRTTKSRPSRATRTRADVQTEFADVQQEVAGAEAVDPKTAAANRSRTATIRNAVQGVTVEDAVTRVTRVGLDVQKALAGVNEQLLAKVTELEQVTEAVELEKTELETLHKIDIAATALDILVQDHATRTKQLDETYAARERAFQEQEAEREKTRREREVAYAIQVQREKDDYEYRKAQERRAAEDAFQEQHRAKVRGEGERAFALEKNWAERENALKAQETEVAKIRQEIIDLPIKLRKDFDAEKAIALNSLKSNLEHAHQLSTKDFQAQATIQQSTIAQLNAQLHAAQEQNARLQTQLTEANSKIETIAKSAIDGASKRDAFEQLMSVTNNNGASTSTSRSGKA
jgi:uncharacterized coiled-coil protein SlyX